MMKSLSENFIMFTDTGGFRDWLNRLYNVGIKGGTTDGVIVICGKERSGKTELAFRVSYGLNHSLWFNQDGSVNISNYCGLGQRYVSRISNGKKGDILIFDEAGTSLYSRDAMSEGNKNLNKKLFVCGYKSLLHILCVPDFFAIDTNIRTHRVKALIRIVEKGKFFAYTGKGAVRIGTEKSWKAANPTSRGWWAFSNVDEGYLKFTKACRGEEKKYKDEYLDEKDELDILPKGRLYKIGEISRQLDVRRDTIQEWCNNLNLKLLRVGKSFRITKEQLDMVVRTYITHNIYNKGLKNKPSPKH